MIRSSLLLCTTVIVSTAVAQDRDIVLATTTSVRDAGLLEDLLPAFQRSTGYRVRVVAVGSGQAMALGRRGEADVLLTHDPAAEASFVASGFATDRLPIMENSFVLVGPAHDPAGLRGRPIVDAFRRLSRSGSRFVTRDDSSGTHAREMVLWEASGGLAPGDWYIGSGQGMSATLQIAHELEAYTLSDIGTFLTRRAALDLEIVSGQDSLLRNPYHLLPLDRGRFPWINMDGNRALVGYLRSGPVQERIRDFGKDRFGESLFSPATGPGPDGGR